MEDFQFEMINIFNKNFKCNDVKKIIKLYKKDISLIEYFKDINLKKEKYQHPLFKNYNYCLFCEKKQKTKYYSKNLINEHMELEDKTIGHYLLNNNIRLREIRNKKEKIVKRRFIHSYNNIKRNENNNRQSIIMKNSESDTELYIYNDNYQSIKPKRKNTNFSRNVKNGIKEGKKKLKTKSKSIKIKRNIVFNNEYIDKNKKMKKQISSDYNKINRLISQHGNSSERKIDIDDSIIYENQKEINNNKNNQNNLEDAKTDINNDNDFFDKNNFIIDIKKSDELLKNKRHSLKQTKNKNNEINLIESTNLNSETKFIIENNKNRTNNELICISKENEKEEDKESHKSNNLFDVFKETKKLLGFGRNSTLLKGRTLSNNNGNLDNKFLRNTTTRDLKILQKKSKNFLEKNDNCSICLNEIKEKFTLICGDFFCRDCIRETIITAMKAISNLDKLHCPTCNEHIEENTIKKLLNEEEFKQYKKLITRIEGLKNKDYLPCPYPDCPGFADISQFNHNNIIYCQNNHNFCKKCLKVLDNSALNEHKCNENLFGEEEETMRFFKENKNYRKCPNCQTMVVREGGGCNNMTCTNVWCGYEFCWICNRKYDDSHYKNPLSMCFGLSEMNYEGRLAKYSRVRFCRCMFIFILIIFVILPVIIVFFSLFEVCLYIISFVLDGSAMKNIKLKSLFAHKFFYKIVYLFFIAIGVAYIPLGYMSLAVFFVASPVFCICNRLKIKNDEELD